MPKNIKPNNSRDNREVTGTGGQYSDSTRRGYEAESPGRYENESGSRNRQSEAESGSSRNSGRQQISETGRGGGRQQEAESGTGSTQHKGEDVWHSRSNRRSEKGKGADPMGGGNRRLPND
jgi:hypothetical protein